MKRNVLSLLLLLAPVTAGSAQSGDHGAARLNGAWTLDLRPTNDAPAYIKAMVLDISADGIVHGEFYDHEIEDGRSFDAKGRTCFAFHTSDNTGPYQTSGCLNGNHIDGQSWSEGRKFLLTWSAVRAAKN